MMLYSAATGGFYDSAIHTEIPQDAVEVSAEQYAALRLAQSGGLQIVADSNGAPKAVDPLSVLSVADLKANKKAELSAACEADILSGFTSAALGAAHQYGFSDRDQANLTGNVVSALMPDAAAPGWTTLHICGDASGVWAYRPHSASQIQQVGVDAKTAKLAKLVKNATLAALVDSKTTKNQVNAINWSTPV